MDQEAPNGVTVHRRERTARRSQKRIKWAGDPERGEGPGDSISEEPAPGCLSNDVLGQLPRIGQGETRRHAEPVDTGGIQVTEKVGTNVNPADLMTKPLPGAKIELLMKIMGCEFVEQHLEREGLHCTRVVRSQQRAE